MRNLPKGAFEDIDSKYPAIVQAKNELFKFDVLGDRQTDINESIEQYIDKVYQSWDGEPMGEGARFSMNVV